MARLNLTLTDAARAAVDALTDDLSEYYSGLVLCHHAAIQTACHHVQDLGWQRGEVTAALELLTGSWLTEPDVALGALAATLADPAELQRLALGYRMTEARWKACVGEVTAYPWLGQALLLLARDYWHSGTLVRRWLERLPQPPRALDEVVLRVARVAVPALAPLVDRALAGTATDDEVRRLTDAINGK